MKKLNSIKNARHLLRQCELGVLSTHSKANEGYPFGSVSTYLSTVNGDVIFYISDLAQHTKNINENAKMCLTVFANSDDDNSRVNEDPNAGARLSILGNAALLDSNEFERTKERYFKLYPDSQKYQGTHDFNFYKLSCERLRYIGGFGDIHWFSEEEWRMPTPEWHDSEQSMIKHMNEDHRDAMQLIYTHHFGQTAKNVEMLTINSDGVFIKADTNKPAFIPFEQLSHTSQEVRQQLVALTHAARAALLALKTDNNDSQTHNNFSH